jgi:hypothetical protein
MAEPVIIATADLERLAAQLEADFAVGGDSDAMATWWDAACALKELVRLRKAELPKLTIIRETSGEVRSVPSAGGCQVIVHPKINGPGGMQVEIPADRINRADRLAPKCRLYCYEGVEERDGRLQGVVVYYSCTTRWATRRPSTRRERR